MAIENKTFNSEYGFGINETTVLDDSRNILNINTVTIQNEHFTNTTKHSYISSGLNNTILTKDGVAVPTISNNTINFITTKVIGVNATGTGHYAVKFETNATVDGSGNVLILGELKTIIKDSIPTGQNWSVSSYGSGGPGEYSYSTNRGGTTDTIKWVAYTEVVSIDWSAP